MHQRFVRNGNYCTKNSIWYIGLMWSNGYKICSQRNGICHMQMMGVYRKCCNVSSTSPHSLRTLLIAYPILYKWACRPKCPVWMHVTPLISFLTSNQRFFVFTSLESFVVSLHPHCSIFVHVFNCRRDVVICTKKELY